MIRHEEPMQPTHPARQLGLMLRLAIGVLLLGVTLWLPTLSSPMPITLAIWPVELALLLFILVWLRGMLFWLALSIASLLCVLIWLLVGADLGMYRAFSRAFNPWVDMTLIVSGWDVLRSSLGTPTAAGLLAAVLLLAGLTLVLLIWGLAAIRRLQTYRPAGLAATGLLSLVAFGALLIEPVVEAPQTPAWPVRASATHYLAHHVHQAYATAADLRRFDRQLQQDPIRDIPSDQRLSALSGDDVSILFIESYGRSALEMPRYAATVNPRLQAIGTDLAQHDLFAVSGWLTSPTMGGQSWLAHGALLSGLWTDNQARYNHMLDSPRASLNRVFREAGWSTVAVMPAITQPWPEADYFGYDRIHAAQDLGYEGLPFNWVTMPDQYTLDRIAHIIDEQARPVMLESALISSHAPWTPIPTMVAWDAVGDGRIFNDQAQAGDPPSVVWRDPDRVRAQYLKSIDYSLTAVGSFLTHFARHSVVIILGDHQPAPIITQSDHASHDVPVHIVTDDPAILARLADWGWTHGMQPDAGARVYRMDKFRSRFVHAMSGVAPASGGP